MALGAIRFAANLGVFQNQRMGIGKVIRALRSERGDSLEEYTAGFKEQAVKHAQAAAMVVAAKELGCRADATQLGQGVCGRQADGARHQAGDTRADGTIQAARRERAA